jgi:hypothetical protein
MPATQISKSQCIELQSNPGYYLLRDAAYAWDRANAAFGKRVLISGAWRSYETQEKLFDGEKYPNQDPQYGRYLRGNRAGQRGFTNDVRWWPAKGSYWTRKEGSAAAAVPGTSNHGGGLAVDVKTRREAGDPPYTEAVIFGSWTDADRTRFLRVAAEHGWYDDEGRSVGELWHLTYYPERDKHRGQKPATIQEEDMTLNTTQATHLSNVNHFVTAEIIDDFDGKQTVEDALRRLLVLARRTLAAQSAAIETAVVEGIKAYAASTPGVDEAAVTEGVVAQVRQHLQVLENTEYVLTPKES